MCLPGLLDLYGIVVAIMSLVYISTPVLAVLQFCGTLVCVSAPILAVLQLYGMWYDGGVASSGVDPIELGRCLVSGAGVDLYAMSYTSRCL